jgi:hypothetical protein
MGSPLNGAPEIHTFLASLAVDRKVSAPTQNQELNSRLFSSDFDSMYWLMAGLMYAQVSG